MSNKSVYLAGPIAGSKFDEVDQWRIQAREQLAHYKIDGFSPLRAKGYLRALGTLSPQCIAEGEVGVLSRPKAIMVRDFRDATTCDVLLVNLLGATRISIGTMMEVAWAYQRHTPIVCCIEQSGNVHEHAMLNEAVGFRVTSLEEGIAICVAILDPHVGVDILRHESEKRSA